MTTTEKPRLVVSNRKHFYQYGDMLYPSVTTILNAVPKPALVNWAAKATAAYAVDNLPKLWAITEPRKQEDGTYELTGSREAAIKLVQEARFTSRDEAAALGSAAHAAILEGGEVSSAIRPHVDQFEAWAESVGLEWIDREFAVVSEEHAYGGTADFAAEFTKGDLAGRRLLCDIKTGRGVYQETELQLSAYYNADVGVPEGLDGYMAVHLRPDFCKPTLYFDDPGMFVTFRAVRRVADWMGMLKPPTGDDVEGDYT